MNEQNRKFWEDGTDYNIYVKSELADQRHELWKERISNFLTEKPVRCLDVGCGPGFISCILAECGHLVTGIDRSADMLKHAKENASYLINQPQFLQMDVNELDFPDNSFDLIISRNVTWTLDDPEHVYGLFYRKLRRGGQMVIYDANWHVPYYHPELLQKVRDNERWYFETFGEEFLVCNEDRSIFEGLPLSDVNRPAWDKEILEKIGFTDYRENLDAGRDLYQPWEYRLYSATPMFEIVCRKE